MIEASFWQDHGNEVSAVATLLLALVAAYLADRAFVKRGRLVAETVGAGRLSPVTETRLRLLRRLVVALILVIGVALALSQFASIKRLATGILASSAIIGVVTGFAARQTLANTIAGVWLVFSQTIRVDDLITWQDRTGTVEDMRLTYTVVRLADRSRLVVPNERLASSEVANHTIVDPAGHIEIKVWAPPDADVPELRRRLAQEASAVALEHDLADPDVQVCVAELEKEGVQLKVQIRIPDVREEGSLASILRERCLSVVERRDM